jgi:D-alanyl-lipoteichoic acid acyltransferase DltB (MBOAT superfamily)
MDYALFVSYFPLLVAGPIERATHLLPQVKRIRSFDFEKAKEGVYQIIWGLVKKVVIADTCATYANAIFDNYTSMNSLSLILGAVYFAFQIYGDFSGYSDMALGMSKLFGLDLLRNFNYPYFSRDIAEFWRRWHISLSSWFRDYLYIPLGGSRGSKLKQVRNVFIIFVVSGFWHGANWTFLAWGFINALYFLPSLLLGTNRTNMETAELHWDFNSIKVFFNMLTTFSITCLAWIFFKAKSISIAFDYIERIFTTRSFTSQFLENQRYSSEILLLVLAFVLVEWNSRYKIEPISGKYSGLKMALCLLAIIALGTYADFKEFIYFQF